jgi:hypothetical protein
MLKDAGKAPEAVRFRDIVRPSNVTIEVNEALASGAMPLNVAKVLKSVLITAISGVSGTVPVMERLYAASVTVN